MATALPIPGPATRRLRGVVRSRADASTLALVALFSGAAALMGAPR